MIIYFEVFEVGYKDEKDKHRETFETYAEAERWVSAQDPGLDLDYYVRKIMKPGFF